MCKKSKNIKPLLKNSCITLMETVNLMGRSYEKARSYKREANYGKLIRRSGRNNGNERTGPYDGCDGITIILNEMA